MEVTRELESNDKLFVFTFSGDIENQDHGIGSYEFGGCPGNHVDIRPTLTQLYWSVEVMDENDQERQPLPYEKDIVSSFIDENRDSVIEELEQLQN